ncbi:MAG: tRNA (N(6)-L-threonylcarbamoyladenosine(37)-C(2))-methylthiotransferase MtaB [Candidatus Omnitrophica bacterium]|nr:tRNA (N(6)-L-threonylcarbamoyladenosine(37)-C(2))-methylthiotransferase MtaB [Candidatus Omnitrophota bacterium]
MKTKISFYTLGCRLNQSETSVMQNQFESHGYQVVDFYQPSDIVVVNTCTVTKHGDNDTRKIVHKIQRVNPQAQIALIGCQAQTQKEILAEMPNVKWVVGNARKMELPEIIRDETASDHPVIVAPTIPRESFTIPAAGIDRQHTRANIKIQDGCDSFCSFCEIPYARGRARSREFDDILKEARVLVDAGHKELVITGINVGHYAYKGKGIVDVVSALDDVAGIERIRISSIEPTTIPDTLIQKMKTKTKLCRYLHIPMQSGHDDILQLMKRGYRIEDFLSLIQRIHSDVPEICIGTDVIVGFPGETDEHFKTTYHHLKSAPINYFHVFSYSKRKMAKAKKLADPVDPATIQERSHILRELRDRKRQAFYELFSGTTQTVLFEQKKDGFWAGLTDNYIRVKTKSTQTLENQLVDVKLDNIEHNFISGTIV